MTVHVRRGEAGFTLVEVLIAVVILSVATVSIVAAMTSTFTLTEQHRGNASADTVARSFEEAIQQKADNVTANTFVPCPTAADLLPTFATPAGFQAPQITTVEYELPAGSGVFYNASQTYNGQTGYQQCLNANSAFTTATGWQGYQTLCTAAESAQCPTSGPPLSAICPPCDPGLERLTINVTATAADLRGAHFTTSFLVRRGNVGADT